MPDACAGTDFRERMEKIFTEVEKPGETAVIAAYYRQREDLVACVLEKMREACLLD